MCWNRIFPLLPVILVAASQQSALIDFLSCKPWVYKPFLALKDIL